MTSNKLAYRPTEAAEMLGIGRTTMFALIADGKIESFTVGRVRLISHDSLRKFVDISTITTPCACTWLVSGSSSSSTCTCGSNGGE